MCAPRWPCWPCAKAQGLPTKVGHRSFDGAGRALALVVTAETGEGGKRGQKGDEKGQEGSVIT
ncbi:MAG: hypothetical protein ACK55Z_32715 [bacterium]